MPLLLLYGIALLGQIAKLKMDPSVEWTSGAETVLGVIMLIGVGFREEVMFRGIACNAIARKYAHSINGIWLTAIASGAVFGALHMGTLFHGVNFQSALTQSFSAFGTGILFCAIYLRGGNIWVMALIHSLIDAAAAVDMLFANIGTFASAVNGVNGYSELIFFFFDLLMAAYLLRKSKQQKILERMQQLRDEILL